MTSLDTPRLNTIPLTTSDFNKPEPKIFVTLMLSTLNDSDLFGKILVQALTINLDRKSSCPYCLDITDVRMTGNTSDSFRTSLTSLHDNVSRTVSAFSNASSYPEATSVGLMPMRSRSSDSLSKAPARTITRLVPSRPKVSKIVYYSGQNFLKPDNALNLC